MGHHLWGIVEGIGLNIAVYIVLPAIGYSVVVFIHYLLSLCTFI